MKLNRKWMLVLALVLSLTMATAGTLAYLTDRDTEVNVFTMGNVDIELKEDFEQGAELIPGLGIEKKPTITNMGPNDAWVWATIAIPSALDEVNDASKNVVHFNYSKDSVEAGKWTWQKDGAWMVEKNVDHDGVDYNVYTVLYQTALKKGETTPPVMTKVYMDPHVDVAPDGELYHVENGVPTKLGLNIKEDGNPKIYVSAYAMQTDGFTTVQEAYAAYTQQWGTDANENAIAWGVADDVIDKPAVTVSTAEELAEALAEGGEVKLAANITTNGLTIEAGKSATIDLNGKTLTGSSYATDSGAESLNNVVNNSGNLTITGEGKIRTRNLKNNAGATLVIDGDIDIVGGASGGGSAIWNEGNCTINGATISQTNEWNYAVINNDANATLVINDANVSAKHGAVANNSGSVTINGGSFECTASGHVVYVQAGSVTINRGSFKHSQQNATAEGNVVLYVDNGASATVNGGTFDSVSAAFAYNNQSSNITFNNGTKLNEANKNY